MKKLLAGFLATLMVCLNVLPTMAACKMVNDINSRYWAADEITFVVEKSIMSLDAKGYFNPEESISRIEFIHSLLKILSNENLDVKIKNSFSDVKASDGFYNDVLRSEQLGLVYGYPDKTFKPNNALLRSEVTSIISHITREQSTDTSVLKGFQDYIGIPNWAINAYAKSVAYGLFVNHPNVRLLEPNRNLTRAEAAVLLYKLYNKINLVKPQYKNTKVEKTIGTEHLDVIKKAPCNEVTVTNLRKIILKDNVLKISYDQKYWSKKAHTGEIVNFIFKNAVYSEEGNLVIPANTCLKAEVVSIQNPKWFNKNARVGMKFRQLILPNGKIYPIDADPYTKDRKLKEGPWMTFAKVLGWGVGLGAIGTGAGIGFAFIPYPAYLATGIAIGTPIGCSVGLLVGFVSPGLHYKAKKGENILIILNDDTSVWYD
ncbi:MAG: S-layer homology domain-containing protein [Candidatus Gastranaerophilaceae bacterium]